MSENTQMRVGITYLLSRRLNILGLRPEVALISITEIMIIGSVRTVYVTAS